MANLFDINAKYGDVVSLAETLAYLKTIQLETSKMIPSKVYQWLLMVIPALVCFGPLFITRFQNPWLQTASGCLICLLLFNQQKRIAALETKLEQRPDLD